MIRDVLACADSNLCHHCCSCYCSCPCCSCYCSCYCSFSSCCYYRYWHCITDIFCSSCFHQFAENSLFIFTLDSPFRRGVLRLMLNVWFERFLLVLIILNTVLLGLTDFKHIVSTSLPVAWPAPLARPDAHASMLLNL